MNPNPSRAPRVSIVMPTLNQAGFIAESVDSVMSQGVDDLELVVADGGSTDGTLELLAALSARHPGQMRWASIPDGGPALAVNAAVERARAPIVGWLNSDDLYTPGAVARALAHFDRHPDHVMVYGHAEHVDERGEFLEPYPTRPPSTPLADWADGCHICQPSAFFRRDTFLSLGGLDGSLRAAFDFDLWLRLLSTHRDCVGFVEDRQARSRLHAAAITMRFRERVALEGMQVVHRHLGGAPAHWLMTHFAEVAAQHPFGPPIANLAGHMRQLAQRAESWLGPGGLDELLAHIESHRAVQCSTAYFGAGVHADGWAGEVMDLRLIQPDAPVGGIRLHCRHASPYGGALRLEIATPEDGVQSIEVVQPGPFDLPIDVAERRPGARLVYRISTPDAFIPADAQRGSGDHRRLGFALDAIELLPT